uniref:Homeobox domain-containing protein n=1 Tax=Leersia perrieri TaxID=77586 RepID=A0A0D9WJQ0_9ORYZ
MDSSGDGGDEGAGAASASASAGKEESPPPASASGPAPALNPAPAAVGGGAGASGSSGKVKRVMKTPYQLEVLERTYTEDPYPNETMRADLSVKLGLTDRQLQMWFCHRRLKDRKPPPKRQQLEEEVPVPVMAPPPVLPPPLPHSELTMGTAGMYGEPLPPSSSRRGSGRPSAVPRLSAPDVARRYYEPPQVMLPPMAPMQLTRAEHRVIDSVERLIGEPLRDDGPVLGVEFDPLPPGAFGAPIVPDQQRQPFRSYEAKMFSGHDTKHMKASAFLPSVDPFVPNTVTGKRKSMAGNSPHLGSRAVREYQFIPEQSSDIYERTSHSRYYDVSTEASDSRMSTGSRFLHGVEKAPGYHGHISGSSHLTLHGRPSVFPSGPTDYEMDPSNINASSVPNEGQYGIPPVVGYENSLAPSDRMVYHDEDAYRIDRKRKHNEEAKIAKEVEAHEKRIRKELEKQDILNRKAEKIRQKEELRKEKEAARQKAANERATARRIAREYMELMEDERLELMELVSQSKGLPSMLSLDSDTLQQLDSFRGMLRQFPSETVRLKVPFSVKPWTSTDDNIGNLLMVWKFFITFADVLGIPSFTLDEFVQSLHDYDSRLLGELHVSLLKSIIKDIEDVARTPSVASGMTANPGGGHPQIVEGAYDWGFNILAWQRHLNLLTWPEILRQFGLSAGFGPHLKKRNAENVNSHDDNEGRNGEDVISILRSGSAAVNAAAKMKERGYTNRRRSRHRLTPGTVKFAAFHVLSLEGSKGLTILEVAEKIQKSGLRDLTTSKTPEASISAALSRDSKLFERTAPSTYCVKTPYRKDPADSEAVLAAAREKIRLFQNTISECEEVEKDVDDAERDEDSECDDADDDPDGDEVNIEEKDVKAPLVKAQDSGVSTAIYLAEETHCASCHKTFKSIHNISDHSSQCEEKQKTDPNWKMQISDNSVHIGLRLLKLLLATIEASVPAEALEPSWTDVYRKSWGVKLYSTSSTEEVFKMLTILEGAIRRNFLSSDFEITTELLNSNTQDSASQNIAGRSGSADVLPWVPDTIAAVALRLLDLDSAISYTLQQKVVSNKERGAGEFMKLPPRYTPAKAKQETEPLGTGTFDRQETWLTPSNGRRGRGRGGRGGSRGGRSRSRGGKVPRGIGSSPKIEFRGYSASAMPSEKAPRKYARRGRNRGRGRGLRTVRPRQPADIGARSIPKENLLGSFSMLRNTKHTATVESPQSSGAEEWGLERRPSYAKDDEDNSVSQSDESSEEDNSEPMNEYDEQLPDYSRDNSGSSPLQMMDDGSDDNEEDAEGDDGEEDGEDYDAEQHGDEDNDDAEMDEDDVEDNDDGGGGAENGDDDEDGTSYSSEYSE